MRVTVDVDEKKMKQDLLKLYKMFLKNPEETINNLIAYDRKYGGLVGRGYVSKTIENALATVSQVYQYGMGTYDNKYLIEQAKSIVKELEELKS